MQVDIALSETATFDNVLMALEQLKIVYGIDETIISNSLLESHRVFFTVALGKPVTKSVPGKYTYNYLTERPVPICIKQNDKISFLDFTLQNRVTEKTTIATVESAICGKNGVSVKGDIIPASILPDSLVTLGANTVKEKNTIRSTCEGMVNFDKKVISVTPIKLIKKAIRGVNIDFEGTVILLSHAVNCNIKATKDIIIHGSCQDCSLDSKGFIYLFTGVSGNGSKLSALFDIFTPYSYNSFLTSDLGNIYIAYETYHSIIKAKGSIIIEKSAVGGSLESNTSIKLQSAGAEKTNTRTYLRLVSDNETNDELSIALSTLKKAEQKHRENQFLYRKAEQEQLKNKLTTTADNDLLRFQKNDLTLKSQLENLKNHIASLKSFINEKHEHTILVFGKVCRGVIISINDKELQILDDNYASSFNLSKYGIIRKKYE